MPDQFCPRAIVDFHRDELGDWVADLACGHCQHVRHNPPWILRPWVTTRRGRESMLGETLDCKPCRDRDGPDLNHR